MVTGFFSYFFFSVRLSLPLIMLKVASKDIIGYMALFLTGLAGFGSAALMIFGQYVPDFTNLNRSLFQMLLIMAGTFDSDAIVEADSFFAPVFLFTFLVVFNLFLYRTFPILIELKVNEFSDHLEQAAIRFFLFITRQIHKFVREVDVSIEDSKEAILERRRTASPDIKRQKTVKFEEPQKLGYRDRFEIWIQELYIKGKKYVRDTIWSDLYPILISHEQSYRLLHAADTHKKQLAKLNVDPTSSRANRYVFQRDRFLDLDSLAVQPPFIDNERFAKFQCFRSHLQSQFHGEDEAEDPNVQSLSQSNWMMSLNQYIGKVASGRNFLTAIKNKSVNTGSALMFTLDLAQRAKEAAHALPEDMTMGGLVLEEIARISTQYTKVKKSSRPKAKFDKKPSSSTITKSFLAKAPTLPSQMSFQRTNMELGEDVQHRQQFSSRQSIEDGMQAGDEMELREARQAPMNELQPVPSLPQRSGSAILDQEFPNDNQNRLVAPGTTHKLEGPSFSLNHSIENIQKFSDVIRLFNECLEAVLYNCIFDEYYKKKVFSSQFSKNSKAPQKKKLSPQKSQVGKLTEEDVMIPVAEGLKVIESSSNLTDLQSVYHKIPTLYKIEYWLKSDSECNQHLQSSGEAEMPLPLRYALLLSMGYTYYTEKNGLLVFSTLPDLIIYLNIKKKKPHYDVTADSHLTVREELNPLSSPLSQSWMIPPQKPNTANKLRIFWISRKVTEPSEFESRSPKSAKTPRSGGRSARSNASSGSPKVPTGPTGHLGSADFSNVYLPERYDLVAQLFKDVVLSRDFFYKLYVAKTPAERFKISRQEETLKHCEFFVMWFSLSINTQMKIIINTRHMMGDFFLELLVSQIVWGDFSNNVMLTRDLNNILDNDIQNLILVTTRNKAITASLEVKKGSVDQLSQSSMREYHYFLSTMCDKQSQIVDSSTAKFQERIRRGQFIPDAFLDALRVSANLSMPKAPAGNDSKTGQSFSQIANETFQNNIAKRDIERINFFNSVIKKLLSNTKMEPTVEFDASQKVQRRGRRSAPLKSVVKGGPTAQQAQSASSKPGARLDTLGDENDHDEDRLLEEHVEFFEITREQERFIRRERRMNEFGTTPAGEVLKEAYQFMLDALRHKRHQLVTDVDEEVGQQPRFSRGPALSKYLKADQDPIPEAENDDYTIKGSATSPNQRGQTHSIFELKPNPVRDLQAPPTDPNFRPLIQTSDEDAGMVNPLVFDNTQKPSEVHNIPFGTSQFTAGGQYPPTNTRFAFHGNSEGSQN